MRSQPYTPIVVQKRLKNGIVKSVNSFRVQAKKKADIIVTDKLLDGVCVFITNHIELQGRGFKVQSPVKSYALIGIKQRLKMYSKT